MSLIFEHNIFHYPALLLDRVNDLVGLRLDHARVIRTLQDHQGFDDLIGMEQRGYVAQHLLLCDRVSDLRVERLSLRLPVRRNAFQGAHPVRHSKQIDPGGELLRPESERG